MQAKSSSLAVTRGSLQSVKDRTLESVAEATKQRDVSHRPVRGAKLNRNRKCTQLIPSKEEGENKGNIQMGKLKKTKVIVLKNHQ